MDIDEDKLNNLQRAQLRNLQKISEKKESEGKKDPVKDFASQAFIPIGIGLLFLVVMFAVIGLSGGGDSEEYDAEYSYTVYEGAPFTSAGYYGYTSKESPSSGNHFIFCDVTVKNLGYMKGHMSLRPSDFEGHVTVGDRTFYEITGSSDHPYTSHEWINKGESGRCMLVFEVPKEITVADIKDKVVVTHFLDLKLKKA